jgi:hypothetical protein
MDGTGVEEAGIENNSGCFWTMRGKFYDIIHMGTAEDVLRWFSF